MHTPSTDSSTEESEILTRYWRSNIKLMAMLLSVWAFVGIGCGILMADFLNQWMLPGTGYPLGFWFAQQGSIVTFVILILIYAILMNRMDRRHHDERAMLKGPEKPEGEQFTGEGI